MKTKLLKKIHTKIFRGRMIWFLAFASKFFRSKKTNRNSKKKRGREGGREEEKGKEAAWQSQNGAWISDAVLAEEGSLCSMF